MEQFEKLKIVRGAKKRKMKRLMRDLEVVKKEIKKLDKIIEDEKKNETKSEI